MSQHRLHPGFRAGRAGLFLAVLLAGVLVSPARTSQGPVDAPVSAEPRVVVATCLSAPGLVYSEGTRRPWHRVTKGDSIHTRDVLVCLPGFKVDVEPAPKTVQLTLWGNLPSLSESPVLESSVILHDTRAYDLDLTLIGGRIVLTNQKPKGAVKVWLRAERGVQLVLPEPGSSVAIEIYGRWPAGVSFTAKAKAGHRPIRLWEVHCLKGKLEIKADRTEWYMEAPPGLAYFHGDNVDGPARSGPEKREKLPAWADHTAPHPKLAKAIQGLIATFHGKLKAQEPDEVVAELLVVAEKDKNKERSRAIRYLVVHAMAALDEVDKVAEALNSSTHDEMRKAAVVALRHWIGAHEGRDERLYEILQSGLHFNKAEAETVMQLLHSPFDPEQAETYETLIAYLKHRKQAVRELAHWHLVRLAPIGKDIVYDASAPVAERDKAAAEWKVRVPAGELPREKDDTKKKEK